VLQRLLPPLCREALSHWIETLATLKSLRWLVPAHYDAPVACCGDDLLALAAALDKRAWAPSEGSWAYLAGIDQALVRWGVVPSDPVS
jgi:hypothetical protein